MNAKLEEIVGRIHRDLERIAEFTESPFEALDVYDEIDSHLFERYDHADEAADQCDECAALREEAIAAEEAQEN